MEDVSHTSKHENCQPEEEKIHNHQKERKSHDKENQDINIDPQSLASADGNKPRSRSPHRKRKKKKKIFEETGELTKSYSEGDKDDILEFLKTGVYKFDASSCSPSITCTTNSAQRHVCKQSTDGARSLIGIQDGRHVFEFAFSDLPWGSHCSIGVITRSVSLQAKGYTHLLGNSPEGWSFDIPSCTFWHDGQECGYLSECHKDDVPHTLILDVDRYNRTMCLDIGRGMEVMFTDLPDPSVVLYPAVSMVYGSTKVQLSLLESTLHKKYRHLRKRASRKSSQSVDIASPNESQSTLKEATDDDFQTVKVAIEGNQTYLVEAESLSSRQDLKIIETQEKTQIEYEHNENDQGNTIPSVQNNITEYDANVSLKEDGERIETVDESERNEHLEVIAESTSQELLVEGKDIVVDETPSTAQSVEEPSDTQEEIINSQEEECQATLDTLQEESNQVHDELEQDHQREQKPVPGINDFTENAQYTRWKEEQLKKKQEQEEKHQEIVRADEIEESEDDEAPENFEQDTCQVSDLPEEDQYLMNLGHGWDFINRGSLIQPYPNVPYICVPMPNLQGKAQGVRCRRGFNSRGIHTWKVTELILFSPTAYKDSSTMATKHNNVIIGVASGEQRKFNFGYSLSSLGAEIWGLDIQEKKICHGSTRVDLDIDIDEIIMTKGLELTLNTVSSKLTFTFQGQQIGEISKVKGEVLYPFVIYNEEAHWPLEISYVAGPKEYVERTLSEMHAAASEDSEGVNNVRILNKRSSSHREHREMEKTLEKYVWGCHSPGMKISNRTHARCDADRGLVAAQYPLSESRHNIQFIIEGSCEGLCLGLLHEHYPMDKVTRGEICKSPGPGACGNDLLSWCWDVQNRRTYHAGIGLSRYPVDDSFDASEVAAFTLTLNFTALGYNTAGITAHYHDKKRPIRELGIVFVSLPDGVVPAVAMRGQHQQSVRMEYVSGPWKLGSGNVPQPTQAESTVCVII